MSEHTIMTLSYVEVGVNGAALKRLHNLLDLYKKNLVDESDFEKLLDDVAESVFETTKEISSSCFPFLGETL